MKKGSRFIYEVQLRYTLETGITIDPLVPGVVPLYYEMAACQTAGYQYFSTWQTLDKIEKAYVVAWFYVNRLIESHRTDAEVAEIERKKKG